MKDIPKIAAQLRARGVTPFQTTRCFTLYPAEIIAKAIAQLPDFRFEPDVAHHMLYKKLNQLSNIFEGNGSTSMYRTYKPIEHII